MINVSGSVSQFLKGLDKNKISIKSLIGLPINDSNGHNIGVITAVDGGNDMWYGEIECCIYNLNNESSFEINIPSNINGIPANAIEKVLVLNQ